MKNGAVIWLAYASAWIDTAAAVALGLKYTGNPNCLWALAFPALRTVRVTNDGDEEEDDEE